MSAKEELLSSIKEGLASGEITSADLRTLTHEEPANSGVVEAVAAVEKTSGHKMSIVDGLFYVAGLILFVSLLVTSQQAATDGSAVQAVILLGTGSLVWLLTYIFGTQPDQTDVKKGLVNSMMLTGCLTVIAGGISLAYSLSTGNGVSMGYYVTFVLLFLGLVHLLFDQGFRHIILIVFGLLLSVAVFPTFLGTVLSESSVSSDIWAMVAIATGVMLAYAAKFASMALPERKSLYQPFLSLSSVIVLGAIYFASFAGEVAILWELLLPFMIYLAFFVSIKRRSRDFLFSGSLFLVLFLITVSFKYFSGLGVSFSLMLSALSLLATAFVASNINKKYIKTN